MELDGVMNRTGNHPMPDAGRRHLDDLPVDQFETHAGHLGHVPKLFGGDQLLLHAHIDAPSIQPFTHDRTQVTRRLSIERAGMRAIDVCEVAEKHRCAA
jgi:hypothetical protein